jgi:hypothetical protein
MARTQNVATKTETVTVEIPRSALTVVERPRAVSQRTSESVLGIPKRPFLELAREYSDAGGTVLHLGKLRLVEIDQLLAWLASRRVAAPTVAANDEVDALANELGLVAMPAKSRAR